MSNRRGLGQRWVRLEYLREAIRYLSAGAEVLPERGFPAWGAAFADLRDGLQLEYDELMRRGR